MVKRFPIATPPPWTPTTLFTAEGVAGDWWAAQDATSLTIGGGNAVSSWRSQVNASAAVQATAANQPIYSATSLNGTPALSFDGVDDFLEFVGNPTGFPTGATEGWIFSLFSNDDPTFTAATHWIVGYGTPGADTNRLIGMRPGAGTWFGRWTNGTVVIPMAAGAAPGMVGVNVQGGKFKTADSLVSVNGSSSTVSAAAVINTGTTRFRIGASVENTANQFLIGKVAMVVVTGALTDDQVAQVTGYMAWQGVAQSKLPSSYPFKDWAP